MLPAMPDALPAMQLDDGSASRGYWLGCHVGGRTCKFGVDQLFKPLREQFSSINSSINLQRFTCCLLVINLENLVWLYMILNQLGRRWAGWTLGSRRS